MLSPQQKRTWAEIDLDGANHNFNIIREQVGSTRICCVIKANGYGHGAVQLAKLYESIGADFFAVSNIEEALQLRRANIILPILILGYTDPQCANLLAESNISQCVFSLDYAKALSVNAIASLKIHIKIDTGMGRIGFQSEELHQVIEACNLPHLKVEGIFTHFSSADEGDNGKDYTFSQFNKFIESIRYLEGEGINIPIHHCANSAAIFDYPEMHLDMVRAGIVLYGLQPSDKLHNPADLYPILTLKTIIDHIKLVHRGDCISYGRDFIADKEMCVATIPIGYADGMWRSNTRRGMVVEVEGKYAPILGRICMDQCMIDVTNIPEAHINSEVVVYGKGECSIDHIADINSTINYEITCAIGERVPRVYTKSGKVITVMDNII